MLIAVLSFGFTRWICVKNNRTVAANHTHIQQYNMFQSQMFVCLLVLISVLSLISNASAFRITSSYIRKMLLLKYNSKAIDRSHASLSMSMTSSTIVSADMIAEMYSKVGMDVIPRRFRKSTKQLATLGPASATVGMIEKLFLAGADVFRLNFSHGEHSEKAKLVDMIRVVEKKYGHPICILADLQVSAIVTTIRPDSLLTHISTYIYIFVGTKASCRYLRQ